MEKQTVSCPECKGLGIIGTSVGSNHFRGHDYDCDVCHGTGYVELFNGNVVSQKHSTQQAQPESVTLRKCNDCGVTCDQRAIGTCFYKLEA